MKAVYLGIVISMSFFSPKSHFLRGSQAFSDLPSINTSSQMIQEKHRNAYLDEAGLIDVSSFVLVSEGCFDMGDSAEIGAHPGKPVHEVCVDDFYLSKYEVTVGDFKIFIRESRHETDAQKLGGCLLWMGTGWRKGESVVWNRPGFSQTDKHPVSCVSWNDVSAYIHWLREKTGLGFQLPTEAEWEYAARNRGEQVKLAGAMDESELGEYAWFQKNSEQKTHPVGQKKPNGLGLYDMSGNVWEWVQDWYDDDYYRVSEKGNPQGPASGKGRVMRGGSWYGSPAGLRVAHRNWSYSHKRYNSLGFRLSIKSFDKTATAKALPKSTH